MFQWTAFKWTKSNITIDQYQPGQKTKIWFKWTLLECSFELSPFEPVSFVPLDLQRAPFGFLSLPPQVLRIHNINGKYNLIICWVSMESKLWISQHSYKLNRKQGNIVFYEILQTNLMWQNIQFKFFFTNRDKEIENSKWKTQNELMKNGQWKNRK